MQHHVTKHRRNLEIRDDGKAPTTCIKNQFAQKMRSKFIKYLALKLFESFQKDKILQCMKGLPNTLNSGKQNDQNENVHAQL
jgi:hypothetical protein